MVRALAVVQPRNLPGHAGSAMRRCDAALMAARARIARSDWRPALLVFGAALSLRLLFALLTSGTFDADEFVIVVLGGAVAHGATPYRDVVFFHPPGMLVLFAGLQHVTTWWPAGRILTLTIDSATAVAVWRIGRDVLGRFEGVVAGLIYAASPIALISGVRVGPDPIITALGTLGLLFLVSGRASGGRREHHARAIGAGICLALAIWTKYAAVIYLPIYLIAAPRHFRTCVVSTLSALALLFAPFLPNTATLIDQTVIWQLAHRPHATLSTRLTWGETYWLLLNPLAVITLLRPRGPRWIALGFGLGVIFLFTAEAYYHYFDVVVPFAALLGAPLAASLVRRARYAAALAAVAATCLWALDVANAPVALRLHVSSSSLAQAQQTASVLESGTPRGAEILTDQLEYAVLAHRTLAMNYFWNMNAVVSARTLERRVSDLAAVVETKGGISYPHGFLDYLADKHFPRRQTQRTVVWLTRGHDKTDLG